MAVSVPPRDHDLLDVRLLREGGGETVEQCLAHHCDARPRVQQEVGVVARGQQGVDRDRHAAGLHRPEEQGGKVDAVRHAHEHAGLHPRTQRAQRIACPVHALRQFPVRVTPGGIDECDFLPPSPDEVGVDEFEGRVVFPGHLDGGRGHGAVHVGELHCGFPPRERFAQSSRTYSKSTGFPSMPREGGAIQFANLPGSVTALGIREQT